MKIVLVLSALVALANSGVVPRVSVRPPPGNVLINGTYEVPLDHFDPTNGERLKLVRISSFCV